MKLPGTPQDYDGRHVLVVGATGYLGAALAARLSRMNAIVTGWARRPPVDGPGRPGQTLVQVDLTDVAGMEPAYRQAKPDIVFHVAGRTNAARDAGHVVPTFRANALGTVMLLDVAARLGCERFVYCASMEEPFVGNRGDLPDGNPSPSSPYAASKWIGSVYTRMFHDHFGLSTTIVRPFFVYGPGTQPAGKLVPSVLNALASGQSPVVSSGDRAMDWVYIDDVVEGFLRAGRHGSAGGTSIDLGTGTLHSVRAVVDLFRRWFPEAPEPVYAPRQDRLDEAAPRADIAATREVLDWSPETGLEKGVADTVRWYRETSA